MTTTEVATIDPAEQARLAALMGADPAAERDANRVPMLKTNTDLEDNMGRSLPHGAFYLKGHGEPVYATSVKIRVLAHHFQYIDYDPEQKKVANKTLLVTSFQQELRDMKGGIRCGRPDGKVWREMDADARKKYGNITCFRQLRCLVSYTGKTADGEEKTVENVPAILLLKGANFMAFDEEVVRQIPSGRRLWDFWIDVTAEKKKNGSVIYYVMHYKPDFATPAPLDQTTAETIEHFALLISEENKKIDEAYNKALNDLQGDADAYAALDDDLDSDLEDA